MENFVNYTKIKDLKVGKRNLNIRAIILDLKFSRMRSSPDDFYKLIISDESARINCALFDRRVTLLKPGDIIYLTNCYTRLFKSELTIYKYPEGNIVKIDEMCMIYNDKIDMSVKQEVVDLSKTPFIGKRNIQGNNDENRQSQFSSNYKSNGFSSSTTQHCSSSPKVFGHFNGSTRKRKFAEMKKL